MTLIWDKSIEEDKKAMELEKKKLEAQRKREKDIDEVFNFVMISM